MAKKLKQEDFQFVEKDSQHLYKNPGDINGIQFSLYKLTNCEVALLDRCGQVTIDLCQDCTIFVGPVNGSIFLRNCKNITISVACGQFRCRDLENSTVYLYCESDPVIQTSKNISFGPYNLQYPHQIQHFKDSNLNLGIDNMLHKFQSVDVNSWSKIYDFSPDESNAQNFKILDPSQFKMSVRQIQGFPPPEGAVEIPKNYGGSGEEVIGAGGGEAAAPQNDGGMMSFDLNISPEQALRQMKAAEALANNVNQEQKNGQQDDDDDDDDDEEDVEDDIQAPRQESSGKQDFDFNAMFQPGADAPQNNFNAQQAIINDQNNQFGDYRHPDMVDGSGGAGGYEPPMQDIQQSTGSFWDQQQQQPQQNNMMPDFGNSMPAFPQAENQIGFAPNDQMGLGFQDEGVSKMNDHSIILEQIDPEQRQQLLRVQALERQRLQQLFRKDQEQSKIFEERRIQAREELRKWHDTRFSNIQAKKQQNYEAQRAFYEFERSQNNVNPWNKVVRNVELKSGSRIGEKDVTRMKQAILNKKNDHSSSLN